MAFALESMTKTRMLDVRVLAAKDRKPDDPPGAQLLLSTVLSAELLAMFDGFLPGMLYRKASGTPQGKLEGMEGSELTSIGDHVKRLKWVYEQTGCTIEIDRGLGGKRNIVLTDCKVHRVSFSPQQGGSVTVQWTVDAPGLSDATWAKLPGLKATDVDLTLKLPVVAGDEQRDIEDQSSDGAWPFPRNASGEAPPQSVTTEDGKKQRRGARTPEEALAGSVGLDG